ncbi:MAG: MiaB/RimO family radical SAM methylthiotransferase [Phycisphaerae bacterium]|nr:MiaB/RimO family radical SAM methylthiotransferase [Phycisphaerae bacterium]
MRVYLETFGCQMNELDSELVRGQLLSLGHEFVPHPDDAQVVLFNTCSVREHAEQKVYSRLGLAGVRKKQGEQLIVGVIGCMAERDGVDLFKRYPQVDLMCGPGELDRLPLLIDNAVRADAADRSERVALAGNKSRRSATLQAAEDNLEMLDLSRAFEPVANDAKSKSAYVRITRGCNKFCTYCVVPHTRGAEVHRPPAHIVDECKRLVDAGVVEITLLGQTINHYRYTHGTALTVDGHEAPQVGPGLAAFRKPPEPGARTTTFADLLHRIHEEVPGVQRLRFVTSYPRDFGDDILQVMRDSPRICQYLHVPAQSGSDRMLKAMNRGYTVAEYLEFIDRVTTTLPDCTIGGDIIVGFCGETDEDFEATCELIRRVPYKNNFIFKYSPRPGTVAFDRLADNVPDSVKRARNNALLALQNSVSARVHERWVGRTVPVFLEDIRERSAPAVASLGHVPLSVAGQLPANPTVVRPTKQIIGRTPGDLIVALAAPSEAESMLGTLHHARIVGSKPLLLDGVLVGT